MKQLKYRIIAGAAAALMMGLSIAELPQNAFPKAEITASAAEALEMLPHTWSESPTVVFPSFSAEGYSYYVCTVCGEEGEHFDIVPPYDTEVQNAKVSEVTQNTATITWDAPNTNCVHLKFVTNGYSFASIDIPNDTGSYTVEGLEPGQAYIAAIWVGASDSEGNVTKSPKHTELTFTTLLPAVEGFKAEASYTTADLTWELPEGVTAVDLMAFEGVFPSDQCGTYDDIISYYKGNPVYTVDGQKPVHTVEGTSYHFDDLYLGTTYTAFVMVHTDSDDKSNVPVTKLEFATKPVEITNLTADTVTTDSIALRWDPFPVADVEMMITVVDDMPDCLSMQEVLEIQNDTANFSDEELEAYVTEQYGEEGWAFIAKYFDRTYQPFRTIEDYADTQLSLLELEENHNYNFLLIPSYHGKLLSESTCKGIKVRTKAQPVFRNLSAEAESYDSLHVTWDALETYADSISVTCCTGIPGIKAIEGADSFDVTAYPEYSGVSAEGLDISKTGCTFDNLAPDTLYTIIAEVRCNHRNRVSVTQIGFPLKVFSYCEKLNAEPSGRHTIGVLPSRTAPSALPACKKSQNPAASSKASPVSARQISAIFRLTSTGSPPA